MEQETLDEIQAFFDFDTAQKDIILNNKQNRFKMLSIIARNVSSCSSNNWYLISDRLYALPYDI